MDRPQRLETTNERTSGASAHLVVWERIVTEVADLQDAASLRSPGSVVNPICGEPYVVDTCCAAVIFAAEYQRTRAEQWEKRAREAVAAAARCSAFRGIHEPYWDVLGWHDVPESLAATGIAVDAYCDALDRLNLSLNEDDVEQLFSFLLTCRTKDGGFRHNAMPPDAREVQNATASALNLVGRLGRGKKIEGHPVCAGLGATRIRLARGQSRSGFWPYFYPLDRLRKVLGMPLNALLRPTRCVKYLRSGDFGDTTHHLMALHFATAYFSSTKTAAGTTMLASAWRWIRDRLVEGEGSGLAIDWTADPTPKSPTYSNSRDTNAYFLILGAIPGLTSLGIVGKEDAGTVARGLLAHVASTLVLQEGRPCITPCEGPPEVVRNILPMFEQSVAWKGRLAADVILALGS